MRGEATTSTRLVQSEVSGGAFILITAGTGAAVVVGVADDMLVAVLVAVAAAAAAVAAWRSVVAAVAS